MTDRGETVPAHGGEPPVDLAAVRADDALLDALGRGGPAAQDDDLAALLAGWHADLSADLPDFDDLPAVLAGVADAPTAALDLPAVGLRPAAPDAQAAAGPISGSVGDISDIRRMSAQASGTDTPNGTDTPERPNGADTPERPNGADTSDRPSGPRRKRGDGGRAGRGGGRPGRGLRRTFAAVAAAVVILGGLALGAQHSGPNGPLWPLTQVLYPEQAHARAAEQAIAEAADALDAGRYDDARHHLDTAADEAAQVDNAGTRQRLLDRIADLRAQLPPLPSPTPPPSAPAATPQTAPTTEAAPATPAPGATTAPGGGGDPTTPGGGGQVIPGLPTQIVPTGPILPLPTQIIPSVPGLPLPTILG
jgi:hypothetical protein